MSRRTTRVRAAIGDNFFIILSIVILLGLGGAYLTYATHVEPGTETNVVEEASWSSTGQYTHQATVTEETVVFERGSVLADRSTYFERIAPVLSGAFVYQYQTTGGGGELTAEIEQTVILRSVEDEDEGAEFWRSERSLGSYEAEGVEPGDRVEAPFEFNVTELGNRITEIEEQLGGTPGTTEISLQTQVSLSGERIGESVERVNQYSMRIVRGGSVYRVENDDAQSESDTRVREELVTATYGPLRSAGAPALLVLSVLACLVLGVGWYQGKFDIGERERERLNHLSASEEFADWISTGHVPEETFPNRQISVDTLEGLVDLAVDSNRRVIEDTERDLYVVMVDGIAYTYDIPQPPLTVDDLESLEAASDDEAETDGLGPSTPDSEDETQSADS
ncbi:MAG: DUF5305 domain-containing protein [Halovenus sp.]